MCRGRAPALRPPLLPGTSGAGLRGAPGGEEPAGSGAEGALGGEGPGWAGGAGPGRAAPLCGGPCGGCSGQLRGPPPAQQRCRRSLPFPRAICGSFLNSAQLPAGFVRCTGEPACHPRSVRHPGVSPLMLFGLGQSCLCPAAFVPAPFPLLFDTPNRWPCSLLPFLLCYLSDLGHMLLTVPS